MAISDEIAKRFPSYAELAGIPEVRALLEKAADPKNDWTSEYFAVKLHETRWWKQNSVSARKAVAYQLGDPAEYNQQLVSTLKIMQQIQFAEGIQLSWPRAAQLAKSFLGRGYTPDEIRMHLVEHSGPDKMGGKLDTVTSDIYEMAAEYGVNISEPWARQQAKRAEMAGAGLEAVEAHLKSQAKAQYTHLAPQLDEGFTTKQIAEPYLQTAAELLERPATAISLKNPLFRKAIAQQQPDGKTRQMTAEEWQRTLTTDARYGYDKTMGAKTAAFGLRDQLAETFGAR